MTVSPTLDNRFREAAAAAGLLDVAYDLAETPVGTLLVAATDRGLCRVSFDPQLEREAEWLAQAFGVRVLRAAKPVEAVRRQLDEYFEGTRTRFELPVDLRPDSDRAPVPPRRRRGRIPRRLRRRSRPQAAAAEPRGSDRPAA